MFTDVVETFETISHAPRASWNAESQAAASSLLRAITDFNLIAVFTITAEVMAYMHGLTVPLQSSSLDIVSTYEQVQHVRYQIAECRVDARHTAWFAKATEMANEVCTNIHHRMCMIFVTYL